LQTNLISPRALSLRLAGYFIVLVVVLAMLATAVPESREYLPFGGRTIDISDTAEQVFELVEGNGSGATDIAPPETLGPWSTRLYAALFLISSLFGTIVLMIPITWVYMAIKHPQGYRKSFVEALIVLPICATTVVSLIQDSLALAFGLAALVTAVRFRVRLPDALDGIYVFAAICVGLASGIGYLGVGVVMTVFFCFASVVLWRIDYGANPVETAKQARKLAELEQERGGSQ
jgi:hypothetical protein